jgi:hypothetical protein
MFGMFCIGAVFQFGMQLTSFTLGIISVLVALLGMTAVALIGCMLSYRKMLGEDESAAQP